MLFVVVSRLFCVVSTIVARRRGEKVESLSILRSFLLCFHLSEVVIHSLAAWSRAILVWFNSIRLFL